MAITITQSAYDDIVAHSLELTPVESCGYLAGNGDHCSRLIRMTNTDDAPDHFTFEPAEMFAALKSARADGQKLVAVYHSHPESPARFSEEDKRLLVDPDMTYMIVSLMAESPDLKAFRLVDGQPVVQDLEIVSD